jgi:hypothetical protein
VDFAAGRLNPLSEQSGQQVHSIGGGLGFGRVDFYAALEVGAIFDADARGRNVSDDGAVFFDFDAAASVDVSYKFAGNGNFTRVNFGMELGGGPYDEFVALERDGAIDLAINLEIFRAGNLTVDLDAGTDACGAAGIRAAETRGVRSGEWNDWRR